MAVNKGLSGKGLMALFQTTESDYNKNLGITAEDIKTGVYELPLEEVYANPNQPRKIFDEKQHILTDT